MKKEKAEQETRKRHCFKSIIIHQPNCRKTTKAWTGIVLKLRLLTKIVSKLIYVDQNRR